jgi:indole-3-glycerol phosphate synthase
MSHLDEILAHKRGELAARMRETTLAEVQAEAARAALPPDFLAAVHRPPGAFPRLIAEIKCASPSKGVLVKDFNPLRLARAYRENGATAISVLTDEHFFHGHLEHLRLVAALEPRLPVLRKDFILEEYPLYEARAAGAAAVLLIAAALPPARLRALRELAEELGLTALVEAHDQPELEAALEAGARLVGINNRDLHTFTTRLETTLRLRPLVPPGVVVVAESGIHNRADVDYLAQAGVDALLVGEALVTAPDTAAKVRELAG